MSERLLSRFVALVEATGPIDDPATRRQLEGMRDGCRQALAIQDRELPWVPSHNDLHLNNVCMLPLESAAGRFVFIDWEAFGFNYAGADLHHFVRLGILEPERAEFFDALRRRCLERLSDMHRLDMRVADLGAHAYALRRAMRRAVLARDASELRLARRIYDRLMRLLA
jgi:thiamine kinase-like enzyme